MKAEHPPVLPAAEPAPDAAACSLPTLDADLHRFIARLRSRVEGGAATYGDTSFTRPAAELVDEVMQDLEDVCGWSLLLWIRLERLRSCVGRIEGTGGQ